MRSVLFASALVLAGSTFAGAALAAAPDGDTVAPAPPTPPVDVRDEVPVVGYAHSAFGASRMTAGAAAYGGVLYGQPSTTGGTPGKLLPQGGARLWGSPVDRLTLSFDIDRRDFGSATPSGTVAVRI